MTAGTDVGFRTVNAISIFGASVKLSGMSSIVSRKFMRKFEGPITVDCFFKLKFCSRFMFSFAIISTFIALHDSFILITLARKSIFRLPQTKYSFSKIVKSIFEISFALAFSTYHSISSISLFILAKLNFEQQDYFSIIPIIGLFWSCA